MEQSSRIPKYHETFIPILKVLNDGGVMSVNDLKKKVRDDFYNGLPDELLEQTTKSGDPLILNRIGWGKVYLKQAEMVMQPERGLIEITTKGRGVLQKGSLTLKELLGDKDFLAKHNAIKAKKEIEGISQENSPQDLIDTGFQTIEEQVKGDLLTKLKTIDPYYFQKVILLLLDKMGYGDFIETPKSGDGGIDGVIKQDKLGLDKIYIQAKRYTENKVREGDIRNFIGAMSRDANKGIFVTTSTFDEKALHKARDASQKIITIDGHALVELMLKHGVGVQVKNIYEVKEIDEDFFEET
jgi:restriction system protein